jgi:endonuclease YncB( thermonuclease family)
MKLKSKVIGVLILTAPLAVYAGTNSTFSDPTKSETITAKVIRVIDGDTVEIKTINTTETLRLEAIDAPSVDLDSGIQSKKSLEQLVLNKNVTAVITGRVSLGQENTRTLYTFGNLIAGKTNVALEQVSEGNALVFHQNSNATSAMLAAEDVAKSQNLGFWAELGNNEALTNWVASTVPVITDSSIYTERHTRGAWRELGWGSLPNCSKLVDGGQNCIKVFGKKVCIPNAPKLITASQKWTVSIYEPTLQDAINAVGSGIASNVMTNLAKCTVIATGAAGVSSFYTGPTAAKITFDGSWLGCMQISIGSTVGASALKAIASQYRFNASSSCAW